MLKLLTLIPILTLIGCATQPNTPVPSRSGGVKPADIDRVRNCEYLDDLIGTSGWYGVFASQGVNNARAELLEKAASIGATHIVWQSNAVGYGSTSLAAKAYRCNE